ncbi:MAG: hypothetical protein ACTHK4_16915, partial [Mycobacteriales bacterium]
EAGHRIRAAGLERLAQDVQLLLHTSSLSRRSEPPDRGRRLTIVIKALAFGIAAALLASGAACSSGSGGKAHSVLSHSPLPDRAGSSVVLGRLLAVGGPAGASAEPPRGRIVVRQRGRLVRTVQVPQDGRFRFTVPPGTYRVLGYSPQYNGGHTACRSPRPTVTVTGGATTRLDVYCQRR